MNNREKLLELIAIGGFFSRSADAEKCVDYLIENGVTIPVRCMECKDERKEIALDNRKYFMCKHTENCHSGNHFCSYGEKNDESELARGTANG